ncbi:MAG: DUF1016 domain-containing protein [Treponema sp.]|nr:DUF1016 domain-containing protein [Treponema sp.]
MPYSTNVRITRSDGFIFWRQRNSVGIIIYKEKNRTIVEYSLKTSSMPIGVSTYTTTAKLPKDYKHLLPDSKTISKKIDRFFEER